MPFRAVNLATTSAAGALFLQSMPGRLESWPAFLDEARAQRLNVVLCLNPLDEVAALSPAYHKAIAEGRLPFRWQHLPMRDFGLGADPSAFRQAVEQVARGHFGASTGGSVTSAVLVGKRSCASLRMGTRLAM